MLPDAKAEFDLALRVTGPDGKLVAPSIHRLTLTTTADGRAQASREGIATQLQIPVDTPGFYRVSVAVRNLRTGEIGSTSRFVDVAKAPRLTSLTGG